MPSVQKVFSDLGLTLIERGWLSSNNVVFSASPAAPAAVVDTGYCTHAEQTVALVGRALGAQRLGRIVNTHLHSDHCGGNALLAQTFGAEVAVPEASFAAARHWDQELLTYDETGQSCERFPVHTALRVGDRVPLGTASWLVVAAPGHDPQAVMFFEPGSGVLISADALWEDRLAIVFPEIDAEPGFADVRAALDVIESLQPRIVIPGHGSAFTDVRRAVVSSRRRLTQFEQQPERHLRYATRALTMFHMMAVRRRARAELLAWLQVTPIFVRLHQRWAAKRLPVSEFAGEVLGGLVADGLLREEGVEVVLAD